MTPQLETISGNTIERLRERSHSPFPPEPPRRSHIVDLVLAIARCRHHKAHVTPHLHGGSDLDKARHEYDAPDDFWPAFSNTIKLRELAGCDVLDVGCGWGGKTVRYAEVVPIRSIVGFDLPDIFDPKVPRLLAREHGVEEICTFVNGLAERMPFDDSTFDVIIVDDVFEHVREPVAVLAECCRVLRPKGVVLIRFPSIRMLHAHHLDRILRYPGLHYVLPFQTWAAGLNYRLLEPHSTYDFEPFDEVVSTAFHTPFRRPVTRNLNGQSFADFKSMVVDSELEVVQLDILMPAERSDAPVWRAKSLVRHILSVVPGLREMLGVTIAFVGRKPEES